MSHSLAKEQDLTEDTEDFVPFPDPVSRDQKRQSPSLHTVREHQRRTRDGAHHHSALRPG